MKFGILKSKIEKKLLESYNSNNLTQTIKEFKKLVLENKKTSTLFYIYDELSTNKGFSNKEKANEYINECTKIFENCLNKITQKELQSLNEWTKKIETTNNYENIDNIFYSNILNIESKIESKKIVVETLIKKNDSEKVQINLPIKTLVNVANTTISKHIERLDEESKNELKSILNGDIKELNEKYLNIKNEVLTKLNSLKENSDETTINKIDESIEKIKSEKFDRLNLYRLKSLNESI